MKPATPAADIVCPTFALMLPSQQYGASTGRPSRSPKNCRSAPTSTTSPTVVAVPCVSTYEMVSTPKSSPSCARRIASFCPSGRGVIGPSPRPSLLQPEPRITA